MIGGAGWCHASVSQSPCSAAPAPAWTREPEGDGCEAPAAVAREPEDEARVPDVDEPVERVRLKTKRGGDPSPSE